MYMQSNKTQVFLSYKYHGENNQILPDYYMAKELYSRLTDIGINTFFSDFSVLNSGDSDYKRLIDDNLDAADVLIVVSTSPVYCNSNWVRYEWDSFYHDILSGRKKGELLSYLDTTDTGAFPRTIRSLQSFKKNDIDSLVNFVANYFSSHAKTIVGKSIVCLLEHLEPMDLIFLMELQLQRFLIVMLMRKSRTSLREICIFLQGVRTLNVGDSKMKTSFRISQQ